VAAAAFAGVMLSWLETEPPWTPRPRARKSDRFHLSHHIAEMGCAFPGPSTMTALLVRSKHQAQSLLVAYAHLDPISRPAAPPPGVLRQTRWTPTLKHIWRGLPAATTGTRLARWAQRQGEARRWQLLGDVGPEYRVNQRSE